jgi:mono/diheme cytochrome c family protein
MDDPPAALSAGASLCYSIGRRDAMRRIDFGTAARVAACTALLATASGAVPLDQVERGRVAYLRYCASCHGVQGDGEGPVARALTTRPSDLRELHGRYGTPLDRERLRAAIDGRTPIVAHSEREMPVWGERFDLPPDDVSRERTIAERVAELHAYIESIQRNR